MLESKAISPEVKGLFETIRSQAKEYAIAFQTLDNSVKEFYSIKESLSKLSEQLKIQVDNSIIDLNKHVTDTLSYIETKTDKTIKIYDDLQSIRDFKDLLSEFYESIKKKSVEYDSTLQSIRAKADVEMELIISNIKNRIEKEVENETQKSEMRIVLKLRQMESKLLAYDQKLWSLNENQSREFKNILDEIDLLRNYVQSYKQATDEVRKKFETHFSQIETEISKKMEYFRSLVSSFESEIKSNGFGKYNDEQKLNNKNLEKSFEFINISLKNLNNKIDIIQRKNNLPLILSIISITGLIILFIILIF
jgi:hypothetical protein